MRTLYLVRHAKSSWDFPNLSDQQRPLNKRGKKDAPKMGKLLKQRNEVPDLMISSPAKRAFSTAKRIAEELGYKIKDIEKNETLYMADTDEFYDVICEVPKNVNKLMLFSHNYGITYFANYITETNIENIPTCGIVRVDFEIDLWEDIENKKGKLIYFEYPKKYPDGI
jgi:phosphohistidine phosphatase